MPNGKKRGNRKKKKATPNGSGSSSSGNRRDLARIERAERLMEPKTPEVREYLEWMRMGDFDDGGTAWNTEGNLEIDGPARLKVAYCQLRRHQEDVWRPKIKALCAVHESKRYDEVEMLATELLDEMRATLLKLGFSWNGDDDGESSSRDKVLLGPDGRPAMYLSMIIVEARQLRTFARVERRDLRGAIDDATEGLAMIEAGAYAWPEFGLEQRPILLFDRGWSLLSLRDNIDGARTDLRACLAALRCLEKNNSKLELHPSVTAKNLWTLDAKDVRVKLAIAMALRKIRDFRGRPLYTRQERLDAEKELECGIYSADRYKCHGCGMLPSQGQVRQCNTCNNFWYCGKDCMKKMWKTEHKKFCNKDYGLGRTILLSDVEKNAFEKLVRKNGYHVLPLTALVIVRDPTTGAYFDSLSNNDVVFIPSELPRYRSSTSFRSSRFMLNVTQTMTKAKVGELSSVMQNCFAKSGASFNRQQPQKTFVAASHELK